MKKSVTILSLVIYIFSIIGFSYTIHFCGNKITSIDFFNLNTNKCRCGSKKMKKDCCKDKTIFLKTITDQAKDNFISFDFSKKAIQLLLNSTYQLTKPDYYINPNITSYNLYRPPPLSIQRLYILYSVFRI